MTDTEYRVLIIEDDAGILELARTVLTNKGYWVKTVNKASDAVPSALTFKPTVVLLDLHVNKVSGQEIVNSLRQENELKKTPIVIFSAIKNVEEVAKTIDVQAWLQKPFSLSDLENVIGQFCCE